MAIDLSGKPIAITGASSGIGAATAIACAQAGMPVVLAARRADKLRAVAQRITAAGGRAEVVTCDVDKPDDCAALVERTIAAFGSIYSIFANAGYGLERPMHETTDAQLRAIFETNFFGTINTIRPALPHMLAARTGHVLICSSCIGKIGIPTFGAYCATKGAQVLVGRSMRHELKPMGVHVSTVHPVGTRTEFFDTAKTLSGGVDDLRSATPEMFMQPPERVARAVVRCLRRPRTEVWTSFTTRWSFALMNAMPRLADVVFDRFMASRKR